MFEIETTLLFIVYFLTTIPCMGHAVKECVVDGEVHTARIVVAGLPGINLFFYFIGRGFHKRNYQPALHLNRRYLDRILEEVEMMARRRELSQRWVANLVNHMDKKEPKTFVFDKPNILTAAQTAVPSPSETVTVDGDGNIPAFLLRAGANDNSEVTRAFAKQLYGKPDVEIRLTMPGEPTPQLQNSPLKGLQELRLISRDADRLPDDVLGLGRTGTGDS